MSALGLCCLRASPLAGHLGRSKLAIGGIADRESSGHRLWFRSQREAERVMQATLSRCFDSKKTMDGLTVKMPPDQVVDLLNTVARSLGIAAIKDCDVATTFDSVHRRIETAIAGIGRDATLKRMRAAIAARINGDDLRSAFSL
jgi:hypothetical protein